MFNFTSLLGAQSTSPASQSLVELEGGIKLLVDVGWDESFSVELLKPLEKLVVRNMGFKANDTDMCHRFR
jgi:cleavage and polyadenylation specificity factor subunit 2